MRKILVTIIIISSLNIFAQEEITCEDVFDNYSELVELHENSFKAYCKSIATKASINPNFSIQNVIRNKQQFMGNYINYFMNNTESANIFRNLAKSEVKGRTCLKDEIFRYDVITKFTETKENIKNEVDESFNPGIEYVFKKILKRLKLN